MEDEDIDRLVSDDDLPNPDAPRLRQKRRLLEEWAAEMADARAEGTRARWGVD